MDQDKLKAAIKKAQEGQEEGFNLIYKETYNFVYFRTKKFVHNEEDTWDVVQEVYTAAFKTISQLKNPDSLYAWLGGITYNLSMRSFRKKKEELVTEEEEGIFEQLEMKDRDLHPEKAFEDKTTSRIIKEMIEELPELQQGALMAYYFDELSVGDIAKHFECSVGTIKSRLNYARKYLKEAIEQKEKKEGFALHGFSIPALLLAFQFMSSENIATVKAAESTYGFICSNLGLKAASLALGTAAVQGATAEGVAIQGAFEGAASIQATGTQAAAALKGTGAVLEGVEKAKLSVGIISKIAALSAGAKATVAVVGITAVTLTGVGVNHYVQNNNNNVIESMERAEIPSNAPSQIPTVIPSPVPTETPTPTLTPSPTPTPTPIPALSPSLETLSGYLKTEIKEKGIITADMINSREADNGGIFYATVIEDESMEEPKLLTVYLADIKRYFWGYESSFYLKVYYPGAKEVKRFDFFITYPFTDYDPDDTDTSKLAVFLNLEAKDIKVNHYFGDHYHPQDTVYAYNDMVDSWLYCSLETEDKSKDYALYYVDRSGRNRDQNKNGYYKDSDVTDTYDEFPFEYDTLTNITNTDFNSITANPGSQIFQSIGEGKIELTEENRLSETMTYLRIEQ